MYKCQGRLERCLGFRLRQAYGATSCEADSGNSRKKAQKEKTARRSLVAMCAPLRPDSLSVSSLRSLCSFAAILFFLLRFLCLFAAIVDSASDRCRSRKRGSAPGVSDRLASITLDSGGDGFGQVFAGAGRHDAGCFDRIG